MLAFTLCSNNHLALEKTLANSWRAHHPNCPFVIGLVDPKHPAVDYSFLSDIELIEISSSASINSENSAN